MKNLDGSAEWLSLRDRLTVILTKARAKGITVAEREFRGKSLANDIREVRATLQALDGVLARCEDMARNQERAGLLPVA